MVGWLDSIIDVRLWGSEAVDLSPYVIPYVFAPPQQVKKKSTDGRPDFRTSGRPDVRTSGRPDVRMAVQTSGRPDVRTSKNNFPKTFSLFTKIPYLIPQPHIESCALSKFQVSTTCCGFRNGIQTNRQKTFVMFLSPKWAFLCLSGGIFEDLH